MQLLLTLITLVLSRNKNADEKDTFSLVRGEVSGIPLIGDEAFNEQMKSYIKQINIVERRIKATIENPDENLATYHRRENLLKDTMIDVLCWVFVFERLNQKNENIEIKFYGFLNYFDCYFISLIKNWDSTMTTREFIEKNRKSSFFAGIQKEFDEIYNLLTKYGFTCHKETFEKIRNLLYSECFECSFELDLADDKNMIAIDIFQVKNELADLLKIICAILKNNET